MPIFRENPDLLIRFRAGEPLALETVYCAYSPQMCRFLALRLARNKVHRGEVLDLLHDIFVKAFSREIRQRFDARREYGPYLYTIARNLLVDWRRRSNLEVLADDERLTAALDAESGGDMESIWLNARTSRDATVYLSRLASVDPAAGRIFETRYVQGLSQRAAAEALGISRQKLRTAEWRLRNGLLTSLRNTGVWRAGVAVSAQ